MVLPSSAAAVAAVACLDTAAIVALTAAAIALAAAATPLSTVALATAAFLAQALVASSASYGTYGSHWPWLCNGPTGWAAVRAEHWVRCHTLLQ